jgi:molybdenum cofactor biosynthesis enzyme MoaA
MDTTTLRVNGVCNADCAFCALSGERTLGEEGLVAALKRLEADRARGAREVRISGGEPLIEPRLDDLIRGAAALGYEEIVLETNGTMAGEPGRAAALSDAGLTRALWALHGRDGQAADGLFRVAGAHEAGLEGVAALSAAGVAIEARTPLARSVLSDLPHMPAWIRAQVPGVSRWRLRPLTQNEHPDFDRDQLPALDVLGEAVNRACREARLADLDVVVEDAAGLPLCLLRHNAHALSAWVPQFPADRSESHRAVEACATCAVADRCPGLPHAYDDRHGTFQARAFSRVPAALEPETDREEPYVVYDNTIETGRELGPEARGPQVTIRVLMPCNQDCTFCFVDRTAPGLSDDQIRAAIDQAAARSASRISFSGGEPTLHRGLESFVARARDAGIEELELQTNALLLAEPGRAQGLADAGLNQAVVSLHAVDVERYQAITGFGEPDTVLAGVRNLLDAGVQVQINVVHNRDNLDHLRDIVAVVAERTPEVQVLFSVTYIVTGVIRDWEAISVRYTDAVPHLVDAMRLARDRGLDYRMAGRCGTPPCAWRDHLEDLHAFQMLDVEISEGGEAGDGHRFVAACDGCAARSHCYGVSEDYLRRFGEDEFKALDPARWAEAQA